MGTVTQASGFWKNSDLSNKINSISVIGLGYVGLPTAAMIANRGYQVIGVDVDPIVVAAITRGETPLVEPDLDKLVRSAVSSGNLKAAFKPEPADVFIISVPTPFKNGNIPDLSYLETAVKTLAPVLSIGNLIIIESTSPVGTTEKIRDWLSKFRPDLSMPGKTAHQDVYIAHSPERVLPGRVLLELVENDRVIGGITPICAEKAASFYQHFINGTCHVTDAQTAEFVKLAANAYRDTNVAFANELSLLCEELNINVWNMLELANRHPRVNILKPGPGVGGHCIAVDPWFLVASAPNLAPLIQAARSVNNQKPKTVIKQIMSRVVEINARTISFLGLAYKANIDDLRESPAVEIVIKTAEIFNGDVYVCEPNITDLPQSLKSSKNIKLSSVDRCLDVADLVVLLTDHREFAQISSDSLTNKSIIDTRGVWKTLLTKVTNDG